MDQNRTATSVLDAPEQTAPALELQQLEVFVGKWVGEGDSLPDSPNPGRMSTVDTYEWLPGGFFLVGRGEQHVLGTEPAQHLWVFGYDPPSRTYLIRAFDSQGSFRLYRASVRDRTWTLTGQWERATLVFGPDGKSFRADWELSKDGDTWLPLCELQVTRAG